MTRRTARRVVLLVVLLAAEASWAGGFELAQQSAVTGGMGSAGTALSDDAAAAWYNPAALADGRGLRTGLGIVFAMTALHGEALATAPDGPWAADTTSGVSTPAYLHASYAYRQWATGVSVSLPFASRVRWPEDWPQRFEIISSEPQFLRVGPFFAWRFGRVRVGAGPHFDVGRLRLRRATNHIAEEGSAEILMSGHGYGFHLSAYADLREGLAVGVSYKSRTAIDLAGDADFDVPEAFASRYPDQQVSAPWTLPDRLALGVAGRLGPVRLISDLSVTVWGVNDELRFDFSDPVTDDRTQTNKWRSSWAWRAGVEYPLVRVVTVRGGFYWDGLTGAPPPAEHLSPSSPDAVRVGFTLGSSVYILRHVALDTFYEHVRLLERESEAVDAPLARYQGHAHLVGVGLRVHTRWPGRND